MDIGCGVSWIWLFWFYFGYFFGGDAIYLALGPMRFGFVQFWIPTYMSRSLYMISDILHYSCAAMNAMKSNSLYDVANVSYI